MLLQPVSGAGHAHSPPTQVEPVEQALPQAPQWLTSLETSVQAPLQAWLPEEQEQLPFSQATPSGQALPHRPQLFGSDASVTQSLPPQVSQPFVPASPAIQARTHSVSASERVSPSGIWSPQSGMLATSFW